MRLAAILILLVLLIAHQWALVWALDRKEIAMTPSDLLDNAILARLVAVLSDHLDGCDADDLWAELIALGLAEQVEYDKGAHPVIEDAEPGDLVYLWTPRGLLLSTKGARLLREATT